MTHYFGVEGKGTSIKNADPLKEDIIRHLSRSDIAKDGWKRIDHLLTIALDPMKKVGSEDQVEMLKTKLLRYQAVLDKQFYESDLWMLKVDIYMHEVLKFGVKDKSKSKNLLNRLKILQEHRQNCAPEVSTSSSNNSPPQENNKNNDPQSLSKDDKGRVYTVEELEELKRKLSKRSESQESKNKDEDSLGQKSGPSSEHVELMAEESKPNSGENDIQQNNESRGQSINTHPFTALKKENEEVGDKNNDDDSDDASDDSYYENEGLEKELKELKNRKSSHELKEDNIAFPKASHSNIREGSIANRGATSNNRNVSQNTMRSDQPKDDNPRENGYFVINFCKNYNENNKLEVSSNHNKFSDQGTELTSNITNINKIKNSSTDLRINKPGSRALHGRLNSMQNMQRIPSYEQTYNKSANINRDCISNCNVSCLSEHIQTVPY